MRISDWSSDVCSSDLIELHQRVDRLRSRVDDVEQALMRPDLELLAALLVDVRRAQHRELLDACRQRNRPAYLRTGALRRPGDLRGRLAEHPVIEGLQANAISEERCVGKACGNRGR